MNIEKWIKKNFKPGEYALITGSTSGIGREYAKALAKLGCNLICISNEGEALREQQQQDESAYHIRSTIFEVDLRNSEATKKVASEVAKMPISILINNAGFGLKGLFETHPIESYIDIITVNTIAPVIFTRAILPSMQQRNRGLIFHVASINALAPLPSNQIYTATKAFCFSYASAVSRENKKTDIQFQIVLPGTTKTPFHDRQGAHPTKSAMLPEQVVEASFKNISRKVCIPNPLDRILAYTIVRFLPRNQLMDLAAYLMKKRLGL